MARAVALLFITGCAGSAPHGGDRVDSAFRAIQRSEARIEAAAREIERAAASLAPDTSRAGACAEGCALVRNAIAEARAGAAGLCETASTLDDHDARTRCERGRSRSTAIEQRAAELRARCACDRAGEP